MRETRVRRALIAVLAASMLGAFGLAGTASARPTPNHFCNTVHPPRYAARGVDGYTPPGGHGCPFMRQWTIAFLEHGLQPPGWDCVDAGDVGGCDRRHSNAYFEWYKLN